MIKLLYDLKIGFDDCFLDMKNREYDLSAEVDSEAEFYEDYHDDTEGLIAELMDTRVWEKIYDHEASKVSKTFFAHLMKNAELIPVWLPTNFRLVYDPASRSDFYYEDGLRAGEVFEDLGINKQQLYYYVKTGQIKKEYSRKDPKKFTYNRLDCEVIKKKLMNKREVKK